MKRTIGHYIRLIFVSAVFFVGTVPTIHASQPQWESVSITSGYKADTQLSDQLEITREGEYIVLSVSRKSTVRVYTILGQLVSTQTIEPGVYRMRLKTRGIYILKCGNLTRRITI